METRPPYTEKKLVWSVCTLQLECVLTTALSWQHTTLAEQLPPEPTPMTVMGEQLRPTRTSTPWTTMPSRPRRSDVAGSLACHSSISQYEDRAHESVARTLCTELQHWRGPVEQELALVGVEAGAVTVTVLVGDPPLPPGMAAARIARERTK